MKDIFRKNRFGILFNRNSLWLGVHYSSYNKRWCINLIPTVTIWIIKKKGQAPGLAAITYV